MATDGEAKAGAAMSAVGMPSQMITWWRSVMALPMTMNVEADRLAGRRLSAYADNMEELIRCRNIAEAAQAQSRFAERMVADYREGAQAVVREVQEAMPSSRAA
jgi:hypothetical protein